jgi:uncharacterized protein
MKNSGSIERRGERAPMQYRRFGKTNKALSVITLGGMRYHDGWSQPRDQPHREMIEHCCRTVLRAREEGINHIETAYGYGKSEHCYGIALSEELKLPRQSYFLMTKGSPMTADETHRLIEEQLRALRTDHIDLYGWHGVNNAERYRAAVAQGGPVEVLRRYQEQGVIGNVGFSGHAPVHVMCAAIETELFEFVNLHYYYFFQRNWAAVQLAAARDMGVFVISPNDKGGRLFEAPALLREHTAPLTPIQWNARFCLKTPHVHTLSFGMTEGAHFDEMRGIFPATIPLSEQDLQVEARLDARKALDRFSNYEGHELEGDPSGINIPEVLRYRRMLRCYDMRAFGEYRYNMFEAKDHWFPGVFATDDALDRVDYSRVPEGIPLRDLLAETHRELYRPKKG